MSAITAPMLDALMAGDAAAVRRLAAAMSPRQLEELLPLPVMQDIRPVLLTPLVASIYVGTHATTLALLEAGASTATLAYGLYPLHHAALVAPAAVGALLDAGADPLARAPRNPDPTGPRDGVPLHHAAAYARSLEHLERLLACTPVDVHDQRGATALSYALQRQDDTGPRIAEALVAAGARAAPELPCPPAWLSKAVLRNPCPPLERFTP